MTADSKRRWRAANPEKARKLEARRRAANPEYARRWRAANPNEPAAAVLRQRQRAAAQAATLDTASRRRYIWTGPELELAADYSLCAREVAEMTGRTLYAVKTMRKRLRQAGEPEPGETSR